ncbi:uncharacterized protein [Drosophila virilis]|uniref:Uncharacterized protein n=1 Tax=Drosophila virilis TaxID=7244 RepID=B4LUH0_DROVI|nr:uncharacterized protein LOC6627877 [Drosophila virilis]EDW64156.1 uncharacterized protein Dvir_GJ24039 [Drosophila virilis]
MIGYSDMSTKPQRKCTPGLWTLLLAMLLFALTLTGVALLEAGRAESPADHRLADVFIVRRLWSHFGAATNESDGAVAATVERIARDAVNASHVTATGRSNNYYEEQQAVVVNAESAQPPMAERRDSFGPPQGRSYEDATYPEYSAFDYGSEQSSAEEPYLGSDSSAASEEQSSAGEGRAAQARPHDAYYGQWQYATQTAAPVGSDNRKLQPVGNRAPYPAYDEVYDYPMGFQQRPQDPAVSKQVAPAPAHAVAYAPPVPTESTLVTFLKAIKQLWDLYQALTSAWGTVSERHKQSTEQLRKKRLQKQRLRQQQQQIKSRINSKKPPRIEGDKFAKLNQTKKAKTTTTTTLRTTTSSSSSSTGSSNDSDESEETTAAPERAKEAAVPENSVRGQRHKREPEPEPASTDVGEGRYIKGDPLKGYYDFVITEGSYKFWAVFQVGTALLIIYSTFAAIYYSKVNPLTSDYDYQDYLGAGRSMSGGDDDFVDDSEPSTPAAPTSRFMDWLPRTTHSLKFILDAIDKMPLDNDHKSEIGWSTGNSETAASDDATGESR